MEYKVTKDTMKIGIFRAITAISEGIVVGAQKEVEDIKNNAQSILMGKIKNPENSTGTLVMSIVMDISKSPKGINNTFMVFTDGSAPYAGYVEGGHGKWGGYHFMEAAFKIAEENLANDLANEIRESLAKLKIV